MLQFLCKVHSVHECPFRRTLAYLVDCPEGHDEDGDEEVGDGQAEDEVVGHVLQVALQQDGGDHEHVA